MSKIANVYGREVLDSRGNPTVEVEITLVHATNTVDFQEFMIMPVGAPTFVEALRWCCEVYATLKSELAKAGLSTGVGDEGGFAPDLKTNKDPLKYMSQAVEDAGFELGRDFRFAMDPAVSELYNKETGLYELKGEGLTLSASELIDYWENLIAEFPIISIEDALDQDDWDGWKELTERLGKKIQLVGDDFFVTNTKRLAKGIANDFANAILIKVNQIGSIPPSCRTAPARPRTPPLPTSPWAPMLARSRPAPRAAPTASPSTTSSCASRTVWALTPSTVASPRSTTCARTYSA